jgi:serine protease Do
LGDSDAARVGDWVVAIGNPFGLSHTVSAGILSARGRTREDVGLGDPRAYYSFIQTDASINPGNSGGPLLDLQGRVVGINTAINPEANSIGFAIPINMVRELLPRLLADGVIERAAIGVHVADDKEGARVLRVVPSGPADQGGIREQDIITAVGGRPVRDSTTLRWLTSLSPIGKKVSFEVRRSGVILSLNLVPSRLEVN